jgi:hypothetical protein
LGCGLRKTHALRNMQECLEFRKIDHPVSSRV